MVTSQAGKDDRINEILKQLKLFDVETDDANAIKKRKSCAECLKSICEEAREQGNWVTFGTGVHFLHELSGEMTPCFFGAVKDQNTCEQLHNMAPSIKETVATITRSRAEYLKEKSRKLQGIPYLWRHRFLEKAIRIIWEYDTWPDTVWSHQEACKFIARCFLDRGRLVLPKGSSIPPQKIEALKKAWDWATKAKDSNSDIDVIKLLIEIGLELELYEKGFSSEVNNLVRTIASANLQDPGSAFDWHIIDRGRSIDCFNEEQDKKLFLLDLSQNRYKGSPTLPLIKAKAGYRIKEKYSSDFDKALFFDVVCYAVKKLEDIFFSSHIWDETIEFLSKLDRDTDIRNAASIAAWQICKQKEEALDLGLQVRMYWSRFKMLYDLAFHVALTKGDFALSTRIADSLKSRPTIKLLAVEDALDKDKLAEHVDLEILSATGGYDPGYHRKSKILRNSKTKKEKTKKDVQEFKVLDFEKDIPKGWAAIHLYLHQDKNVHALICSANSKKLAWDHKEFKVPEIWQKFQAWQAADRNNPEFGGAAPELDALCRSLGQDHHLGFLFNEDLPENLVLIPHGFFHLVPIHSALKNGEILLKQKKCIYLPSWSLVRQPESTAAPSGEGLFYSFEDHDPLRQYLQPILQAWKHPSVSTRNTKVLDATTVDVKNYLQKTTNPELLVFLCHGKADPVNPYNSRLLLRKRNLTHADLVRLLDKMPGTRVFLGACETDMSPSKQKFGDEHLSISTAFLQKGASEIAGGLWQVAPAVAGQMVEHICADKKRPLVEVVWEKQKDWWYNGIQYVEDGKTKTENDSLKKLYYLSAFRVIGLPCAIGENTDE